MAKPKAGVQLSPLREFTRTIEDVAVKKQSFRKASLNTFALVMFAASCQTLVIDVETPARAVDRGPDVIDVEPVWSGHGVGFSLLTDGNLQFVAYYDAKRQMTVAIREITSSTWTFKKLPSHVKWDSHNYITMALDAEGLLHVSGNMHCNPLIYFRSGKPRDVITLKRVTNMVRASKERRVTYPHFMRGAKCELIFRYRDGGSGRGNDIYNVYDPAAKSWRGLLDHPLLDGKGKMNGYFSLPKLGPDGRFHVVGVWRDTSDAATNHHASYARSRDLVAWETASGRQLKTPLTVENIDVVDPIPSRAGLINGNCKLGFDSDARPIVSYHKYDDEGNSQIYCARFEGAEWRVYQVSNWQGYRWSFGGGGSIPFDVRVGGAKGISNGRLSLRYSRKGESGTWALDEDTLQVVGPAPAKRKPRVAPSYNKLESNFPGIAKHRAADLGANPTPGVSYMLSWETLGANRDRPRKPPLPAPSMLRVYKLVDEVP
jgi:hypothetical protein